NIVYKILLTTCSRVLSRKMIPNVDYAADNDLEIELIDIRRVGNRIAGRVGPRQHHSKLLRGIGDHSGGFKGRAAADGERTCRRFVEQDTIGALKHSANVQQAPSLVRTRKRASGEPAGEITRRVKDHRLH